MREVGGQPSPTAGRFSGRAPGWPAGPPPPLCRADIVGGGVTERYYARLSPSYVAETVRQSFGTPGIVPEMAVVPMVPRTRQKKACDGRAQSLAHVNKSGRVSLKAASGRCPVSY